MTAPVHDHPRPPTRPRMPSPRPTAASASALRRRPGRDRPGDRRRGRGPARRDRRRCRPRTCSSSGAASGRRGRTPSGWSSGAIGAAFAGEVRVTQGFAGSIIAREATLEQGIARNVIAQKRDDQPPVGDRVLIAQHVEGDVRPILEWRGALAAGAVIGLVAAIGIAVRTGEREARRPGHRTHPPPLTARGDGRGLRRSPQPRFFANTPFSLACARRWAMCSRWTATTSSGEPSARSGPAR